MRKRIGEYLQKKMKENLRALWGRNVSFLLKEFLSGQVLMFWMWKRPLLRVYIPVANVSCNASAGIIKLLTLD